MCVASSLQFEKPRPMSATRFSSSSTLHAPFTRPGLQQKQKQKVLRYKHFFPIVKGRQCAEQPPCFIPLPLSQLSGMDVFGRRWPRDEMQPESGVVYPPRALHIYSCTPAPNDIARNKSDTTWRGRERGEDGGGRGGDGKAYERECKSSEKKVPKRRRCSLFAVGLQPDIERHMYARIDHTKTPFSGEKKSQKRK